MERVAKYCDSESSMDESSFFTGLGYDGARVDELARSLRELAENQDIVNKRDVGYAVYCTIEGPLKSRISSVADAFIESTWLAEEGEKPVFIAAGKLSKKC